MLKLKEWMLVRFPRRLDVECGLGSAGGLFMPSLTKPKFWGIGINLVPRALDATRGRLG